ncbi:MAG: class I SAM-dependent methyltransferase [Treponema sp.]|nr:class I SAM-dependent methyltransferase [Treponema sp.]
MERVTVKTWSTPVVAEEQEHIPCTLCGGNKFKPSLSCSGFSYVKCCKCSLVQVNPQPPAVIVERRYSEFFGNDYLSYELTNEASFLELQKRGLKDAGFFYHEKKIMKKKETPGILDIGCATGALLDFLKERGWQTTGVEISPAAEYARTRRMLDVKSENLEKCHFPGESFDMVLASHLIEHLNNPMAFLHEVWRIMRPGARLMLTTPNIDGMQARLFGSRWRSAIFDHLYLFSAQTLRKMLKAAGFVTEGVYTWGGLAAGTAPLPLKRLADITAKALGFGDVMLVKARKVKREEGKVKS